MGDMTEQRGYYAVIPARILHDMRLSSSAKLLYGEISVRCNEKGYCWATNASFSHDLRAGERTVTRLISELEQIGAIKVEIVPITGTKSTRERRIFIEDAVTYDIAKNGDTANFGDTGVDKNGDTTPYCYSLRNNMNNINNTPISPKNSQTVSTPSWKPDRFEKFYQYYRKEILPKERMANRKRTVDQWDKLKPDDELIDKIAKALSIQKNSSDFQRGYAPDPSMYLKDRRWEQVEDQEEKIAPRYLGTKIVNGQEVDCYG